MNDSLNDLAKEFFELSEHALKLAQEESDPKKWEEYFKLGSEAALMGSKLGDLYKEEILGKKRYESNAKHKNTNYKEEFINKYKPGGSAHHLAMHWLLHRR